MKSCKYIYKKQINYIISIFYRTRNPKKIVKQIDEYLDHEIGISNGIINSEISNFSYDENLGNSNPLIDDSSYMDYNDIFIEKPIVDQDITNLFN